MIFKDYYKILGLESNMVSMAQIKNAYREQAKKYHPDVNVGNKSSEERFKDINEAYRILSETSTKRKYDRIWNRNVTTKRTSYSYNSKANLFTMFFGNVEEEDFSKIDNKIPSKGENLETEIKLNIKEAFLGVTKNISLRTVDGKVKTLKIKVPAGIRNNEKIRIVGQGKPRKNGGKNGNLYVKVKILENNDFLLDGYNIIKKIKLLPWEAVLGSKITIEGINEDISLYIPAGTNSEEIIKIEGKGYIKENKERGDLILKTQIIIPEKVTEQEKNIYESLKKCQNLIQEKS